MDKSDDMVSNDQNTTVEEPTKRKKGKRVPKCKRCQNHEIIVPVKWHKIECPYRNCICIKCIFTAQRQRDMKGQTAMKRAQYQFEQKQKMKLRENGTTKVAVQAPAVISKPSVAVLPSCKTEFEKNALKYDVLFGYSTELLHRFSYPSGAFSLMYGFLKVVENIDVAIRILTEANNEIAEQRAARLGIPFFHPGYAESLALFGSPTYCGPAPFVGLAPPTTTAACIGFPYPLGLTPKVESPDSPPERPKSFPDPWIKQAPFYLEECTPRFPAHLEYLMKYNHIWVPETSVDCTIKVDKSEDVK